MRCCLASTGRLSWRDLTPARTCVVDLPSEQAAAVLPLLLLPLSTAPQAAQVRGAEGEGQLQRCVCVCVYVCACVCVCVCWRGGLVSFSQHF